jgi:ligand-binding SRPBCC domain-containing protein
MVRIEFETRITAPLDRCFDLARSIDLHVLSTGGTGERAIAGKTSGLIEMGETVTWRGRHFGVLLTHTSKIIAYDRPRYFKDCMIEGAFKRFEHEHKFSSEPDGSTLMIDLMEFEAPLRVLGVATERLVLRSYLQRFLKARNSYIKHVAEADEWKEFLHG